MIMNSKRGSYYAALFSLVISGLAASIVSMISGLLLIDISNSFNITVGVAGQMRTLSFIISIVFALYTSVLSVNYDHKLLLQLGLIAYIASAIGCYLASNFSIMMISYALTGIGYAFSTTTMFTLTSIFPQKKRGEAIGFIIAGMSGSYLIGALVVPYLQSIGGWRLTFFGYMLPFSILALILVSLSIPRYSNSESKTEITFGEGLKAMYSNKSALFSLLAYLLGMIAWQSILTYNSSFLRDSFQLSIGDASLAILVGATLYTLGSIFSSRIAGLTGRKTLVTFTILGAGLLIMFYSYVSILLVSLGLVCGVCLLVGIMDASSTNMIIEQVPLYAGIMMSFQRVVTMVGSSIGSGIGGLVLTLGNYQITFLVLGFFGVISAIVFQFLTTDNPN